MHWNLLSSEFLKSLWNILIAIFRLAVNIRIVQLVEVTTVQAAASERVLIMEAQAAGVATASVGLQVNFSPSQRNFIKQIQYEAKLGGRS